LSLCQHTRGLRAGRGRPLAPASATASFQTAEPMAFVMSSRTPAVARHLWGAQQESGVLARGRCFCTRFLSTDRSCGPRSTHVGCGWLIQNQLRPWLVTSHTTHHRASTVLRGNGHSASLETGGTGRPAPSRWRLCRTRAWRQPAGGIPARGDPQGLSTPAASRFALGSLEFGIGRARLSV